MKRETQAKRQKEIKKFTPAQFSGADELLGGLEDEDELLDAPRGEDDEEECKRGDIGLEDDEPEAPKLFNADLKAELALYK